MQLYAFDEHKAVIPSHLAKKGKDYLCCECEEILRVKSGKLRHPHFYHLNLTGSCRQSGKSAVHLAVQKFIARHLLEDEVQLERRFPEIQRIADVVWETKKIIFEVQCSQISEEEVLTRSQDFRSLGYQVVWILHVKRYGRQNVFQNPWSLLPHYYTDINAEGFGKIYDRCQILGEPRIDTLTVRLDLPMHNLDKSPFSSKLISQRMQDWEIFFSGDALHSKIGKKRVLLERFFLIKKELMKGTCYSIGMYKSVFNYVLEYCC